jgi:hypothetical protein
MKVEIDDCCMSNTSRVQFYITTRTQDRVIGATAPACRSSVINNTPGSVLLRTGVIGVHIGRLPPILERRSSESSQPYW